MEKSLYSQRHERMCHLLRTARTERGQTQAELSAKLGRPQSFVAKYEKGERRLDVIEFLEVAAAIGVDPRGIFDAILKAGGGMPPKTRRPRPGGS
jgi:transcriptional regulator with XRE-family HTH domain